MCDYSLHGIKNRLAEEGETLVVHRFYTGSKGLTSPEYLQPLEKPKGILAALKFLFAAPPAECAVCIPDGARLLLHDISPGLQKAYGLSSEEPVTFRQLSADAAAYRDAVEFGNCIKICLQDLEEGQKASVLSMAASEAEAEAVRSSERPY